MKRHVIMGVMFGTFFAATAFGVLKTQIRYEASELDSGRWQYTYEVTNISLTEPIKEFTIWFDFGLYDNLAVETTSPLADSWDEIVWQPDLVLRDDGAYDAKTVNLGIGQGETIFRTRRL